MLHTHQEHNQDGENNGLKADGLSLQEWDDDIYVS